MLNANNEINVKKEERKHSWSTVFAWLYLKTIGRILPKRWNRWAENILYYDKTTANNEVQTDAFKTVDESAQVDLKPEVAEKESQSVVISKDGGIQTDEVALCVEKVDKSVEVNLKPEVAEKESQSEIMSEDEGIYSEVSGEPTNESFDAKLNGGFIDEEYNSMEEICTEDDKPLKLQLAEVEGDYIELKSITDQIEKEFSDELEELRNETEKNSVEIKKKDARINILTALNEALKQDIKKIETRSNEQQQMAEIYMKLNELLLNVTEIPEKTLQLNNQEQQEEKKSLENKILELQKQVQTLEGNKEWELAGIDGTLKETFLTIMELLAQQLLNNQEQSVKEQKLEELTLPYNDQAHQMERLQLENLSLGVKNGKLLSVIERSITEEAEVRKMDEQVEKNQYRLINQIVKLEGALKEKGEQLKESQRTLESLEYRLESLESQSATTKAQQRKDSSHQTSTKSMAKGEADLSNQKKEWEADSNKKAKEIENLKGSKRKLEKNLQETKKELAEQKELAERATKEVTKLTSKIKNVLDEVNKLQEEKRNIEEQLKIMQQQLLNDQERQRMGEELKDVDKRLEDIEKTKKSQEYTKVQRKPLQDKNLEHFLSDRNMGLKKDFPEFKEKTFSLTS